MRALWFFAVLLSWALVASQPVPGAFSVDQVTHTGGNILFTGPGYAGSVGGVVWPYGTTTVGWDSGLSAVEDPILGVFLMSYNQFYEFKVVLEPSASYFNSSFKVDVVEQHFGQASQPPSMFWAEAEPSFIGGATVQSSVIVQVNSESVLASRPAGALPLAVHFDGPLVTEITVKDCTFVRGQDGKYRYTATLPTSGFVQNTFNLGAYARGIARGRVLHRVHISKVGNQDL